MSSSVVGVNTQFDSIYDFLEVIYNKGGDILGYRVTTDIQYYSSRYGKYVLCKAGDKSDGATMAVDIDSFGWIFHDELCATGTFRDGSKCTNWQASMILKDILRDEGRWVREYSWFLSTWLFGGGKARDNGMW